MATPEEGKPLFHVTAPSIDHTPNEQGSASAENASNDPSQSPNPHTLRARLRVEVAKEPVDADYPQPSPSRTREEAHRLDDELTMQKAERMATSTSLSNEGRESTTIQRSRSRRPEPLDEFDTATNPLHTRTALYQPPEHPSTQVAKFFKYIHGSSFIIRYFTYIVPIAGVLLTPVLIGALAPVGQNANVGGVKLMWFGIWLEIVWLTLWAGRLLAKMIPWPMGLVSSLFTNNAKKWRDLGKQLEMPATLFFWMLAVEISFLPTMIHHHIGGNAHVKDWESTMNKVLVSFLVAAVLNFIEKIIIQLIAISFHLRTYADRIEINKFQIGSLTKLYAYSKAKIDMEDAEFEEKPSAKESGTHTPAVYAQQASQVVNRAFAKVGDLAGTVAGDFTGKKVAKSGHPSQVVLTLLNSTNGSQVLARRLYRTFVPDGKEAVDKDDLKPAFDAEDEADAAFSMFDKDMNGDISMEELEAVCVEMGRERKSITASLKDLDSVVGKLDDVLFFIVLVVAVLVLISLLSTSAAGVLTSAGSAVLALSWLFSATAQEFLQSCVFVFVKHPFDVGDRVSIYGNTGAQLKGDDYFVKEVSLLYTEFKKMEGQVVQAPNSYLNTLFILNMRRSGGLAEAVPIIIRFGTTIEQIEAFRAQLMDFVKSEKREYQGNILTELREVTEAYSLTLNVVFFYKSNWQNELLRLQRRNKFICAMMLAMQEVGIEGPRRNQAGWGLDVPYYLHYPAAPSPLHSSSRNDTNSPQLPPVPIPEEGVLPNQQPSSLRRRRAPSTGRLGRDRNESISSIAKKIDLSLGMKDVSSSQNISDIYEDHSLDRYRDIIRETNRIGEESRTSGVEENDGRSNSRGQRANSVSHRPHMAGGIFRRSTEVGPVHPHRRESVSSTGTHRNRFFDRLGRRGYAVDVPGDSLIEEGRAPLVSPRWAAVPNQAERVESISSFPSLPNDPPTLEPVASGGTVPSLTTQSKDFYELQRVGSSSKEK
ncbi:hypothetical protein DV737_g4100, partial [Chaetothyriales sp. CBS 132003]